MQAAEGTAWRAVGLIEDLPSDVPQWPSHFIAGVCLEPFAAEDARLRFKFGEMKNALRALKSLDARDLEAVLNRMISGFNAGSVRDPRRFNAERSRAIANIREVAAMNGLERLEDVASALEAVNAGSPLLDDN